MSVVAIRKVVKLCRPGTINIYTLAFSLGEFQRCHFGSAGVFKVRGYNGKNIRRVNEIPQHHEVRARL
jgi:hypothetical protein